MTMRTWIAAVVLIGCGGGNAARDGAPADATNETQSAPDVSGNWVSACTPAPQADGSTRYFRLDFDIDSASWALDYDVFADPSCATRLVTVAIAGPYEVTTPSSVDGAWNARFGFSSKTITPHVEPIAQFLNSQEGCGAGDWQAGTSQSVLETGCPAFGQYPVSACPADFDLVGRDRDTLRFGDRPADNDMCTEDRRPTRLAELVLQRG